MAQSQLTQSEINELKDYINHMDELSQREPEPLPSEFWDKFFEDMSKSDEIPLKYRDKVSGHPLTVYGDFVNGKYCFFPEGKTIITYSDTALSEWQKEVFDLQLKYETVIEKARYLYFQKNQSTKLTHTYDIIKECISLQSKPFFASVVSGNGLFCLNRIYSCNIPEKQRKKDENNNKTALFERDLNADDLVVYVKDYINHQITVSTHQLIDWLTLIFTENKGKEKVIRFSLSEYMKERGLSVNSVTKTRQQLQAELETLHNTSIRFTDKMIKAHDLPRRTMDLIQGIPALIDTNGRNIRKTDDIEVLLSDDFYGYLCSIQNHIERYPRFLLKLNAYKEKYVYSIGRYIADYERTSAGKTNQGVLTVKKILKQCGFPTIEQAKDKKSYKNLIIKPFLSAWKSLKDEYGYLDYYVFKDQTEHNVNDKALETDFKLFLSCTVVYKAKTPDEYLILRRDKQKKRAAEAKKRNIRSKSKNTSAKS